MKIPSDQKITYAHFFCDYFPLKDEKWRARLVVVGDKLEYDYDTGSPATDMLETKLLFKSVISDAKKEQDFVA